MGRVLKWIGIGVVSLLVLVLGVIVVAVVLSTQRQNQRWSVAPEAVVVPTDSASIARGEHFVRAVSSCTECHGADLGGKLMMDSPVMARLAGTNLTRGRGGVGGTLSDADFVRAIRHGVRPDGSPLIFMPSESYQALTDADLGAMIAYIRSVPPVDREVPKPRIGPLARVLHVAVGFPLLPAELIDHHAARPSPTPGVTAEYGTYLGAVSGCTGCHGPALAGGGGPGPNITAGGGTAGWSESDFLTLIRTGKRPNGTQLTDEMPWKAYSAMSDDELKALWLFVRSMPPVAGNTRGAR
jgi:mono/diheme cytochrome c family protein